MVTLHGERLKAQLAEVDRKYKDVHMDDNWRQNGSLNMDRRSEKTKQMHLKGLRRASQEFSVPFPVNKAYFLTTLRKHEWSLLLLE